jgi:16S rRNA (guanine1207-N2)-methyltransferase
MLDARLALALDGGGLVFPEGRIAVFSPRPDIGLEALSKDRVHIISGFKPDVDHLEEQGFSCLVAPQGRYAASIVCLPRAKPEARCLIQSAFAVTDGPVIIDGQKTDGIDSLLKEIRKRTEVHGLVSKAHGKLFYIEGSSAETFADWADGPALTAGGFWTAPGVFSADGIDPASALLADALPAKLGSYVADLGAGWGFLSAHILTRDSVREAHLIEANHIALECARRNVTDPRARFHWQDATTWQAPLRFDCVVMNPPFHTGRAPDPSLGQAFVASAARILAPQGQLWMVANRHLPYETTLSTYFAKTVEVAGDARFKLLHAQRPLRSRK